MPPWRLDRYQGGSFVGDFVQAEKIKNEPDNAYDDFTDVVDVDGLYYWHNYREASLSAEYWNQLAENMPPCVISETRDPTFVQEWYMVARLSAVTPNGCFSREERDRFESEYLGSVDQVDSENREPTERLLTRASQRHKERCRALAEYLWQADPLITIADMFRCDAITSHGCEGEIYTEGTLRDWIKDLCPNRKPGRRPKN